MPIYDFKCPNCGTKIKDEYVPAKDLNGGKRIVRECPKCKGEAVRQIGTPMFYFRRPRTE